MFNAISAEETGQTPDAPQRVSLELRLGSAEQHVVTDQPFRIGLINARAILIYANLHPLYYKLGDSTVTSSDQDLWLEPATSPHQLWLPPDRPNYLSVVAASDENPVVEITYLEEL